VILLLVELLVLPGFGVAGVTGALAIVVSIFLSLVGRFPTAEDLYTAVGILAGSVLLVGFAGWQLIRRLPEDRRGRNLLHREELRRELGFVSADARVDLVGLEGTALTDLRPARTAEVNRGRIGVVSGGSGIEEGRRGRGGGA